jgi:hypothetical protein
MKWFKHMSTANKDDKLVSVRANFGLWGIGAYWSLVEFAAEQLEEKSERAEATLIVSELIGFFGCKRDKLETFLEHSQNVSLIKFSLEGNILKLDIPKLVEFADNYIKYDGKSLKSLQRQREMSSKQEVEVEEDKKKKENILVEKFAPDTPQMLLTLKLVNGIRANDPRFKTPDLQRWATHIDSLLRLDERPPQEIAEVIDFATTDDFWKSNILSTKKLREKFTTLIQKKNATQRRNGNSNPNSQAARAGFKHTADSIDRLRKIQETLRRSQDGGS